MLNNSTALFFGVTIVMTVVCGASTAQDLHPSSPTTEVQPLQTPPLPLEPELALSLESIDLKPRDLRPLAVLGIAIAVQVAGLAITLPIAVATGFTDRSVETAYGIYLGVTPAVGVGLGSLMAKTSPHYDIPVGSMFLGGYLGAALAYGSVLIFMEHDDPKVDGYYDGKYFNEDSGGDVAAGILILGAASILLPAAGVAIGCAVGRKRKEKSGEISWTTPSPTVFLPARKGDPRGYGLTVLGGTF